MKKYCVWLIEVFGYANPVLTELIERFGSAKAVYDAFKSNTAAAGYEYALRAEKTELSAAEKLVNDIEAANISIITYESELFPETLRNVPNPPVALFAKGNISLLSEKLLTIGGSRKISDYTIAAQTQICTELCKEYTLVASLIEGCEQLTCLTAVKCGKGCIEILPCGFDYEYPKGSRVLREQILMNNGCIITEFLPDIKSNHNNFLRRARISGGISKAMLIFQAGVKSGSLNAAKYSPALFFLPPHDIFSPDYTGSVKFIRNGASLYYKAEDLEHVFSDTFTPQTIDIKTAETKSKKVLKSDEAEIKISKQSKNEKAPSESIEPSEELFETAVHYSVFRRISKSETPLTFDEIYRNEDVGISELNEILLDLEISDMIKAVPGSRYTVC